MPDYIEISQASDKTDETVVADSDLELEAFTSLLKSDIVKKGANKTDTNVDIFTSHTQMNSDEASGFLGYRNSGSLMETSEHSEEDGMGNPDIIFSQSLVSRQVNKNSCELRKKKGAVNFKCFRKTTTRSGNSFSSLVQFAKYPYKESNLETDVVESMKEEKQRKKMESIAEDLFRSEKRAKKGIGSLSSFIS